MNKPGYADIAAHFRRQIEDGELNPGDVLPAMSQVQRDFGVALNTVNRAYKLLKDEGLTVPQPGANTVVASRPRVATAGASRLRRLARTGKALAPGETSTRHETHLRSCADPEVARLLGVDLYDEVVVRSRVYVRDGIPSVASLSIIHMRALADMPELNGGGPSERFWQEVYTERTGRQVTRTPQQIRARLASTNELELLDIDVPPTAAVPVIVLVNTFHDENGPLEVWEDVHAPGLWQIEDNPT